MKQTIRTVFAFFAISLAAALPVAAQRILPLKHSAEHSYLANQRSMIPHLSPSEAKARAEQALRRESIEEIYADHWDSQSVNPYGSDADIPRIKNINVAEGVVPVPGQLSSPYGWRARFGRMHRGVDLRLSVGDTVRSAFTGKVRLTKYEGKGYGYYVVVRHDNGMETVYGHLSRFLVKPGQRVKAGEPIALGGNTGRSTGPHLHFETRYMGCPVNPEWIFDFGHRTTIKDIYTFDYDQYKRAQVSRGSKSRSGKVSASAKASGKSKVSKRTSSRKNATKRRSRRR